MTLNRTLLVLKTNLNSEARIAQAATILDAHPDILRWNVDRWDCDHVLRVEAEGMTEPELIDLLREASIDCSELPD